MAARNSLNLLSLAKKVCLLQVSVRSHQSISALTACRSQPARSLCASGQWRNQIKDEHPVKVTEVNQCVQDPYTVEKEKCILCKYQVPISYKNVQLLSQFVSPNTGRIFGRHITKLCEAQHRRVAKAVKRAIRMGFMANQHRGTQFLKDPNLYDVKYTGSTVIGEYSKLPDSDVSEEELLERNQQAAEESKTPKS